MEVLFSKRRGFILTTALTLGSGPFLAQHKIISSSFSSYNVSAENMCSVNISSELNDAVGYLEAKISNNRGQQVIMAVTAPFRLKKGIFNTAADGILISSVNYQNSDVSDFVKLYHQLPSGLYSYCVTLKSNDGSVLDDLCESIESETSSFLSLIFPADKDTIEGFNPLLIWTHRESFNLNQQGEYFRMLVTEIKEEQNPEAAITVNNPLFKADFLTSHEVLYPLDAPRLLPGVHYGWQVQKVTNGVITNKTEAWEFVVKNVQNPENRNFVEITPKLNLNPYVVSGNKIFFVFREEYFSDSSQFRTTVVDSKGKSYEVFAKVSTEGKLSRKEIGSILKDHFEISLDDLGLDAGYYSLNILNNKNQEFVLKFLYK